MFLELAVVDANHMTDEVSKRYDEIPYESNPFFQSHPRWLATVAQLFGIKPPALENARILELGCASGGNLVPVAESLPGSTCLGIDLSQRQISDGQAFVKATGLSNVELKQVSILDFDKSYGQFDYIICHGVFSWVKREIQEKILEICNSNLSPTGVAYVSYNTYPGWHMQEMLRNMMRFHASRFKSPQQQIAQSRALLNVLARTVPSEDNPFGLLLKKESESLSRCTDWYIYHEHLEATNEPVYFHEFAKRALDSGLQFLGESELRGMLADQMSPEIQEVLKEVATNLVFSEQYMDFFRNRTFRTTLLCHRDIALNRKLTAESVASFCFASGLKPKTEITEIDDATPHVFEAPGWPSITARGLNYLAALQCLGDAWPEYVPAAELERRVRARLGLGAPTEDTTRDFLNMMWSWFSKGVTRMSTSQPPCTSTVSAQPVASRVARAQAKLGNPTVTNLQHLLVGLNAFNAYILSQLDGTLDRAAIVERVVAHLRTLTAQDVALANDPAEVDARVAKALTLFAQMALLRS